MDPLILPEYGGAAMLLNATLGNQVNKKGV